MTTIEGKVWGNTCNIFNKNGISINRIQINKGGYCSKHKHEHKYNSFFIETGKLKIKVWKNDYDLVDETIITKSQTTIVRPGEMHMFEALENTIAYEIYWTECLPSDIIRENVGGQIK